MKIYNELESLGFFEWLKEKEFGSGFTPIILDGQQFDSIERSGYNAIAFRFFREKHNLRGFIGFRPNAKKFDYHIYNMALSGTEYIKQRTLEEFNKDPKVGTYEEAELECLKKLIEIVKSKQE